MLLTSDVVSHVFCLRGARLDMGRTDYIDLCGEPEFMQLMTLKYHEAAQAKGVIVMHACAFGEHRVLMMSALKCAHLEQIAI